MLRGGVKRGLHDRQDGNATDEGGEDAADRERAAAVLGLGKDEAEDAEEDSEAGVRLHMHPGLRQQVAERRAHPGKQSSASDHDGGGEASALYEGQPVEKKEVEPNRRVVQGIRRDRGILGHVDTLGPCFTSLKVQDGAI